MRKTLLFGTGAAIGFLLGARSGRETYDSIMENVQSAIRRPTLPGSRSSGPSLDLTDTGMGRSSSGTDRTGTAAADWLGTGDAAADGDLGGPIAPVAGTNEHFGSPRPGL